MVVAFVSLVRLFQQTGFEIKLAQGFGYLPAPWAVEDRVMCMA